MTETSSLGDSPGGDLTIPPYLPTDRSSCVPTSILSMSFCPARLHLCALSASRRQLLYTSLPLPFPKDQLLPGLHPICFLVVPRDASDFVHLSFKSRKILPCSIPLLIIKFASCFPIERQSNEASSFFHAVQRVTHPLWLFTRIFSGAQSQTSKARAYIRLSEADL